MKTKFLLFLIIAGMLFIDISCGPEENQRRYEITGIRDLRVLTKTFTGDTVTFNSILFQIGFTETHITFNKGFSFIDGIYADEIPMVTILNFDSIKIFSINDMGKTDATNQFSISKNYYDNSRIKIDNSDPDFIKKFLVNEVSFGQEWAFYINTPPAKTDTCQFNFQFFDKKGRMFEKMSQPVIISP